MASNFKSSFPNQKAEDEKDATLSKLFQLGIETLFLLEDLGNDNLELYSQRCSDCQIQYIGELFNLAQM